MIIHFSGIENLDRPGVWVFPDLLICLDCGRSLFTVEENEFALLARRRSNGESLASVARLDDSASSQ
jgi:hypothetical protein